MSLILLTFIFLLVPLLAYSEVMAESANTPPEVRSLAPVEITVTRTRRAAADTPSAVTKLDVPVFGDSRGSLGALLRGVAGVVVNGGGRLVAEQPSIRGLSGDRVLMRLDGARKNFSNVHRGRFFIDTELVKQVEVLRGPGSVYYGSGAVGGVIDVRTKSAIDFLDEGERYGSTLKMVYDGNDDRRRGYWHGYGLVSDNVDVLVSLGWQRSHDYTDGSNVAVAASGNHIVNGLIKSTILLPHSHELEFALQRWQDDARSYTTPELDASPEATTVPAFARNSILAVERRTQDDTFSLRHRSQGGRDGFDWDNHVYYSRTEVREDGAQESIAGRRDERAIRGFGIDIGASTHFGHKDSPWGAHVLRPGFDVYTEKQTGRRERDGASQVLPYPSAEQTLWGLYLHDDIEWQQGRLHGSWGVRFDSYQQEAEGTEGTEALKKNSDQNVSPKASLLYRLGLGFAPYVSYAEAFRAPSLTELYSNGIHIPAMEVPIGGGRTLTLPANRFVVNEDLRPERVRSLEGGITLDKRSVFVPRDQVQGRALYVYSRYDDFIEQTLRAQSPMIVVPIRGVPTVVQEAREGTTMYRNVAAAEVRSIEASLAYKNDNVSLSLAASRLRGEDRASGQPLSGLAADRLDVTVEYRLLADFHVGWRSQLVAAQNRVVAPPTTNFGVADLTEQNRVNAGSFTGLYPTPGYGVHDMYFKWSWGPGGVRGGGARTSSMAVHIDNIFDKTYRPHTSNFNAQGLNLRLGWQRAF